MDLLAQQVLHDFQISRELGSSSSSRVRRRQQQQQQQVVVRVCS
jgi:hypothetical protein